MFQTFSGSGRRPRQVNLSGRQVANPFARVQPGSGAALANAHQDRLARQQERDRTQAANVIQRTWRGAACRRRLRAERRRLWDEQEALAQDTGAHGAQLPLPPYASREEALVQFSMLLFFLDLKDELDLARLERFDGRLSAKPETAAALLNESWRAAYLRLERECIRTMLQETTSTSLGLKLVAVLRSTALRIPEDTAQGSLEYYRALRRQISGDGIPHTLLVALTIPLRTSLPDALLAYGHLATEILSLPLRDLVGTQGFSDLAARLDHDLLGQSLAARIRNASPVPSLPKADRVWLLANFIHIYRLAHHFQHPAAYASGQDFVLATGTLLASLADEIELEASFSLFDDPDEALPAQPPKTVDPFVKEQISTLVDQENIGGLLGHVSNMPFASGQGKDKDHSRILAIYILTLLRLFPRRGDEIRMWLYLGLRSDSAADSRPPVIRYFWQSVLASDVFKSISRDSRAAIQLLQPGPVTSIERAHSDTDDEWRVILIFLELYIFVLKVMDDDEFLTEGNGANTKTLRLDEIASLTLFLKNLGFTMYYNAPDILGSAQTVVTDDLSKLFKLDEAGQSTPVPKKAEITNVAGIAGISLDYVKGLVTGILRQVYARDSRRPFLPKDHWLMTSRFDMTNFIDAVVEEEERRNRVQQQEDEEEADEGQEAVEDRTPRLVGSRHALQTLRVQQTQRQQRKASRRRYLQAVAPRLEILQNMPFLIPFATRVKIFRRFVYLDKIKRRGGTVDGDLWRMNQIDDPMRGDMLNRHHAKIRRDHEFEDAYDQFFELGAGFKEPIQITFIDKFDSIEAGIDGGGVTKEFLTSVTSQVRRQTAATGQDGSSGSMDGDSDPKEGVRLFAENDQHLLYPNPSALEEQRELLLTEFLIAENDPSFRPAMQDLLRRFEFLGRVIGKCLYEGILVDIGFASFFLLKWALTGGAGSAPRESGYRASINDLRDFDESLYQGLLTLKNYPGDVERDFSLDFTVADTLALPDGTQKTITRDLKPGGAQLPVTNANRLVYISDIARHRLQTQPYHQTNAFLRGLAGMVEPSWLSMFNQAELQTLVGGAAAPLSIPDLRRNTVYGGVYAVGDDGAEHASVRIFWAVMEALGDGERRAVLRFVTSTPRAPLLGFASLSPRFSIRDAGADEARLPSTSTCVNLLKLPRYSSASVCRAKLLQAVHSGAGFDLS